MMSWWQVVTKQQFNLFKERVMADIKKLQTDVAALVASLQALQATATSDLKALADAIAALKQQIADGGGVSQNDIDVLDNSVQTALQSVGQVGTQLDTAAQAVAPPPAPPTT